MSSLTTKDKRYDRQLRLWGDHGQRSLESAHVCLINATGTGSETLKNLVLPGIGAFTILDSNQVTASDLNSNFFVTPDKLGSPRGACVSELLCELNSEVRSKFCSESLNTILESSPQFLFDFSIVIATDVPEDQLARLASLLWSHNIPLLVARSYGMIGYLRLVAQSHEVVESHPDNTHEDLRIDLPFPSLKTHMDKFDLEPMDNTAHGNVPFLVILFKHLDLWRASHDGSIPKNYREKKEFKELVKSGIRCNEDGVPLDEENFDEAIANVNSLLVPTKIPSQVQEILDDDCCKNLSLQSSNFWILVRALSEFISNEGEGCLPLRGSIPDMMSSSDLYIALQRVYQAKANQDVESFTGHLIHLLSSIGKPENAIPEQEIKMFCRNSAFLYTVRTRSLSEELTRPNTSRLAMELENPDSNFLYYVLLRGAEAFYSRFKTYPGNTDLPLEADISHLRTVISSLLQDWGLTDCSVSDEYLIEFCRYGGTELHSVAAYIGGVASQEVIKVITKQYVPINNTYIYNAASSTSNTAEM